MMRRAWEHYDADRLRRGEVTMAWAAAQADSPEEARRIYSDLINARTEREAWKKINKGRYQQRW